MLFEKFDFYAHGKERLGVLTEPNVINRRQSRDALKSFYKADIILSVNGNDENLHIQKNRFPNSQILITYDVTHIFYKNQLIEYPCCLIYNNKFPQRLIDFLDDPILIDFL